MLSEKDKGWSLATTTSPSPRRSRRGNGFGCPRPWRKPRPQEKGEIDGGAGWTGWPPASSPWGDGVLAAISAIFLYLLWATLPLLQEASQTPFGKPGAAPNAAPLLALDSRGDYLIQLDGTGHLTLQALATGETVFRQALALDGAPPRHAWPVGENGHLYAVLLESGALQFFALEFPVRVNEGVAQRTIRLSYPFGQTPLPLPGGVSGNRLQSFWEETQLTLAYISETKGPNGTATLHLLAFDEVELGLPLLPGRHYRYPLARAPERLARRGQQWLFLDYGDRLEAWFARFADSAEPAASLKLSPATPRALSLEGRPGSWGRPMARSGAPFPFGIAPAGSALRMPAL